MSLKKWKTSKFYLVTQRDLTENFNLVLFLFKVWIMVLFDNCFGLFEDAPPSFWCETFLKWVSLLCFRSFFSVEWSSFDLFEDFFRRLFSVGKEINCLKVNYLWNCFYCSFLRNVNILSIIIMTTNILKINKWK